MQLENYCHISANVTSNVTAISANLTAISANLTAIICQCDGHLCQCDGHLCQCDGHLCQCDGHLCRSDCHLWHCFVKVGMTMAARYTWACKSYALTTVGTICYLEAV